MDLPGDQLFVNYVLTYLTAGGGMKNAFGNLVLDHPEDVATHDVITSIEEMIKRAILSEPAVSRELEDADQPVTVDKINVVVMGWRRMEGSEQDRLGRARPLTGARLLDMGDTNP